MPITAMVTTRALPPSEMNGSGNAGQRQQPDHPTDVDDGLADQQTVTPAAASRRNGSSTRRAIRSPV